MRRRMNSSSLTYLAREAAKAQREAEREEAQQERERIKAEREAKRQLALSDKEAQLRYQQARIDETEDRNQELKDRIEELLTILSKSFITDSQRLFNSLRRPNDYPPFTPPQSVTLQHRLPSPDKFLSRVQKPSKLQMLVPGTSQRYSRELEQAEQEYNRVLEEYKTNEANRLQRLATLQQQYTEEKEQYLKKIEEQNQEMSLLQESYNSGDITALLTYYSIILDKSPYSYDFPQKFRISYSRESRELAVEYQLPGIIVIPTVKEYVYIKAKDLIDEKPRKLVEIKELYQDLVASICLRTISEIFGADQANFIDVIVFNGFVCSVDASTGQDIRPCLISVRTTKNEFLKINLNRVDKLVCLKNLGAQVSSRPAEMQPVKPIIEFDMFDKRYVEQSDILADLESRPNLMELNPFEFENLVSNLFTKMGLDTKQTRSSKDGGVDAIAYDSRPILGGKVVIQAKRYKNTVGVSAVRDLYGTMMNEGANKGILVTTSGYGPDAFEFAKGKPIELIDGGNLLYLLDQIGIKARIIFPEE